MTDRQPHTTTTDVSLCRGDLRHATWLPAGWSTVPYPRRLDLPCVSVWLDWAIELAERLVDLWPGVTNPVEALESQRRAVADAHLAFRALGLAGRPAEPTHAMDVQGCLGHLRELRAWFDGGVKLPAPRPSPPDPARELRTFRAWLSSVAEALSRLRDLAGYAAGADDQWPSLFGEAMAYVWRWPGELDRLPDRDQMLAELVIRRGSAVVCGGRSAPTSAELVLTLADELWSRLSHHLHGAVAKARSALPNAAEDPTVTLPRLFQEAARARRLTPSERQRLAAGAAVYDALWRSAEVEGIDRGQVVADIMATLAGFNHEVVESELTVEFYRAMAERYSSGSRSPQPGESGRRVVLRGREEGPVVLGRPKRKLNRSRYNVVKAALDAPDGGWTKDELVRESTHEDALGILRRLAESDADWKEVIHLAGQTGGGYWIK